MNLSFAGCGFLGIYHVGVAVCFRKFAPHLLLNKISGASAGALAACCLLLDLPLGDLTSDVLRVATEARSRRLGPFNPNFQIQKIIRDGLERALPKDAHTRVTGKLHISLTRMRDGKNVIISEFETREDLINVLLASAFIPLFSGLIPPKYRGVRYMDGGFSDNLPTLDENTITVSPFCGESDICPRDESSQLFHINVANTSIELSKHNIYRIVRILFPPQPEILANMCKQGFDDALRFMQRNNLISCTRCLSVQSTFVIADKESDTEDEEFDPNCLECKMHQEEATYSHMPETVLSIFQESIDSANKGLYNWIFKHKGMKLLSFLALPYMIPADVMYATLTKLLQAAPLITMSVWEASKFVIDKLNTIYYTVYPKPVHHPKVFCHLSVSEYGDMLSEDPHHEMKKLDFSLDFKPGHDNKQLTAGRVLSRRSSLTLCTNRPDDEEHVDDTFEHVLNVTSHHEAVMAFYYLDENNKVKVTEIYDVTEDDSPSVQTPLEREANKQLQFDDDWDTVYTTNIDDHLEELLRRTSLGGSSDSSDYSITDLPDNAAIFSDPESEWPGSFKVEQPEDDQEPTCSKPKKVYPQLQF